MSDAGIVSRGILQQVGEGSQNPHPSLSIEHLLHENTALKSKLALSEDQRVIENITRHQLQNFLITATQRQPLWNYGPHTTTTSLSVALQKLCEEKAELEAELQRTRIETTQTLNHRINELEQERKVLQTRLQEFEMRVNDIPPRPYAVELDQLRQSEELLRQQLKFAQEENVVMVDRLKGVLAEELAVLPTHIEKAEAAQAALRESHRLRAYLEVEIEEQRKRFEILHELQESRAEDARLFHQQETLVWQQLLGAALERERILLNERAAFEVQAAAAAQRQVDESKSVHDSVIIQGEGSFAIKRTRVETSQNPQSDESIRTRYVRFWHDGHARVAALEQRVHELESTEGATRVLQGRIAQFERERTNLTVQLVNLADALSEVRETNHQLRAQYVGLEVERDQLLARLTEALGGTMQHDELVACSSAIREAASRQSAASATTITDPEGLQQAMRQTRELKNEIVQLQRQKENLLRCITLREDRVEAMLKREAMLVVEGYAPSTAQVGDETFPLTNFLELVERSAKDIFAANEACACDPPGNIHLAPEPKGVSRHHGIFLRIQQDLNESQMRLRDLYLKLQESNAKCQHLTADLVRAEAERVELLFSKNTIEDALRTANAAIESLTNRLASQHTEYDSILTLQKQTQTAFACVFELYREETQLVEGLRALVQQEREDIIELVRRETEAWLGANDGATHEQSVDIKPIIDALERLNKSMQDDVTQAMLNNSAESTKCLATLVESVKDQEERLDCIQKAYTESATQLATSLAERIINAKSQWESQWRDKHLALEHECAKQSLHSYATRKVHEALEQVAVEMNTSVNTPSRSSTSLQETVTPHSADAKNGECALTAISVFLNNLKGSVKNLNYPNERDPESLPVNRASSMITSNENKDRTI
ncbi:unnamed protein product [Phytomonas sp. EM1]|nr:unnamed protein product [Phytomonas sp. EM1]|eukprot:CCW65228.1 unnamed protein product [Phytomonas sp. isolate EM1]